MAFVPDKEQPAVKGRFVADKPPEPEFEREARETLSVTPAELISANPIVRTLTGAARPVIGTAALIERLYGGTANQERIRKLDEMQARGAKALGYGSLETAGQDIAGAVLSPVTAIAAGAPAAAGYLPRVAQAAELGALGGVTSGSEDPMAAAAVGGAVGGAVPAVGIPLAAAGKAGYHAVIEPLSNTAAIKGRAFLEAAGDKADEIIALLRQNKQLVPGSAPTAGQAAVPAGRAEFAALQQQAERVSPTPYMQRAEDQASARLTAIRSVGQDKTALATAESARKTASDPLYAAAREGTGLVYSPPIVKKIDLILSKNPGNRELVTELTNIKNGLGAAGSDATKVSSVLDGMKASLKDEKNTFIRGILTDIKNDLSRAIPDYEKAQAVFAVKSAPVNQMQVGQYLEQKLTSPLDETARQRAASYAGALREAPTTIKRATGAPRFEELSEVLTPKQMEVVNSVRDDLARGMKFETLAAKGMDAAPKIQGDVGARVPSFWMRTASVYNAIVSKLEGKVDKKLAAEIAVEMLNPPRVADSLAQAKARAARNALIAKSVEKSVRVGGTVAAQAATKPSQPP